MASALIRKRSITTGEAPANSPSRTREEIRRINCSRLSPRAPVVSHTRGTTVAPSIPASSSYLCFFSYSRFLAAARGREEVPEVRAEGMVGWVTERSRRRGTPSRERRRSGHSPSSVRASGIGCKPASRRKETRSCRRTAWREVTDRRMRCRQTMKWSGRSSPPQGQRAPNVEEEEGGKRRRSRAARRKSSLAIISSGREGMTASQLEAPDCRRLRRWEDIATELPTECES